MNHPVKTLLAGAVVVALSLLLTGCLEVQLKFDLRDTGSGTATWIIEIPKTTADTLGLTTDKLKAELLKDSQFRGRNVQITAGRAPNGNQILTAVVPFENVQEISAKDLAIEFQKNPDGKQCSFRIEAAGRPDGAADDQSGGAHAGKDRQLECGLGQRQRGLL